MNYFTVLESNSKIMRLIFSLRKELAPFFSERDIDAVTVSLCLFFYSVLAIYVQVSVSMTHNASWSRI